MPPSPPQLVVAVGSSNPVKVNSVRNTFSACFPERQVVISSHDVPSGVPDQPWGDLETRQGALNRAAACHAAHLEATGSAPHFAVGLEGGVCEENLAEQHPNVAGLKSAVQCFAFMAIMGAGVTPDSPPRWGIARTASFQLPQKIISLMRGEGGQPPMELGDADDAVFSDVNSKQKGGTVAKATKGMIDRTAYYEHAMFCALAPFLHDDTALYADS